jgi:cell division septum initiation protein DivIVA
LKFKLKARNNILALALFTYAGASLAASPTTEELQQQIEELKNVVEALKQQVQSGKSIEQGGASLSLDATATKDDISGLRSDLENYKYDVQRLRDYKTAATNRGTTITGTVQVRANTTTIPTTSGAATTQSTPRTSSFDIPLAQLAFAGNLYKDYGEGHNLDYKVGLTYAKASATTTTLASTSAFNLQDAYLQYSFINPAVTGLDDPTLNLRLGQQQAVFGLEAQTTDELKPTINAAQFVAGLGLSSRQIGLILRGDINPYVDYGFNYRAPLFEYAVGIVNGSGANQSDNNSQKDFLARFAFTAPVDYTSWLRELKFGTSYQHGTKNILTSPTAAVDGHSDRYGFDIYYNHLPFGATYEYASGRDDSYVTNAALPATTTNIASTNTRKIGTIKSVGQSLTLFYTWGEQWLKSSNGTGQGKYDDWWPKTYQPFFRFDRWDPNTANTAQSGTTNLSGKIDITTLGFNLFFAETTKLQINLNDYKYYNLAIPKNRDFLVQFQYGF